MAPSASGNPLTSTTLPAEMPASDGVEKESSKTVVPVTRTVWPRTTRVPVARLTSDTGPSTLSLKLTVSAVPVVPSSEILPSISTTSPTSSSDSLPGLSSILNEALVVENLTPLTMMLPKPVIEPIERPTPSIPPVGGGLPPPPAGGFELLSSPPPPPPPQATRPAASTAVTAIVAIHPVIALIMSSLLA